MPATESSLIAKTNLSDEDMMVFYLSKQGYGSIAEIENLDTKEFLDLVEFEHITNAIESYRINEAHRR